MLFTLASDLRSAGHHVATSIDRCLAASLNSGVFDTTHWFDGPSHPDGSWLDHWLQIALQCDKVIVIAPEIDGLLLTAVNRLREHGCEVIASSREFLESTSDKLQTALRATHYGLSHPATHLLRDWLTNYRDYFTATQMTNSRWVVKSRDGAGCNDMKLFSNVNALLEYFSEQAIQDARIPDQFIVQEWIPGRACSAAILCDTKAPVLLGAVEQQLEYLPEGVENDRFEIKYVGGAGPLQNISSVELQTFIDRVFDAFNGARGWIGIDFVVATDGSMHLIEINPRMTTSYLGYRQWYGNRIAQALASDCMDGLVDNLEQSKATWPELTPITFSQDEAI